MTSLFTFIYLLLSVNEELSILIYRISVNNFIKMIHVGLNMVAKHLRDLY